MQRTQLDANAAPPEFRELVGLLGVLGIQLPYQLGALAEQQLRALCVIEDDGRSELPLQHPVLLPSLWAKASALNGQRLRTKAPLGRVEPGGLSALQTGSTPSRCRTRILPRKLIKLWECYCSMPTPRGSACESGFG